ncbi:TonB-dependent receptor [Agarivorans sp. QJM3NY_25]|uniref:TonB-dependent receptor n=1 Tax=Agarivorans sp. QJM3NY_25 TaxID=3421430 RepID=UPI003D7C93DA
MAFSSQSSILNKLVTRGLVLLVVLPNTIPAMAQSQAIEVINQPWSAVYLDYLQVSEPMLGVTLSLNHYDRAYPNWGYYFGYAKSKQQSLLVSEPAEAQQDSTMLRLGLSYSLSHDFSIYGGGAMLERSIHYTSGITPMCRDCQPTWQTDIEKKWGAELGLRYAPSRHLIFSLGYNAISEGGVFGIGYRG